MSLTPEEIQELKVLRIEQEQGLLEPEQPQGLSPEEQQELAQLRKENENGELETEVISPREASLGAWNRARYAIEPLESNRKALLVQEFGGENVREIDGEMYLKENEKWRPVNAEGLSTADFADLAGSAPEIFGAGAGAMVGMGAGSVPASFAGGLAGSVVRQGLSGVLGTPQESATVGERVAETALSGGMSALGTVGAKGSKWAFKKAVKNARKLFPKMDIGDTGKKLIKIAKEQNLPEPTKGQLAGGKHLEIEKALGERRFWGRGVREQTKKQIEAIKNNLDEITDFAGSSDNSVMQSGGRLKDYARARISKTKEIAGDLFDKVAEAGKDVTAPREAFKSSLIDNFNKLGVLDEAGAKRAYTFESGLTRPNFKKVQNVFSDLIKAIDAGKSAPNAIGEDVINVNTLNTMRKTVDSYIKEGALQGQDNLILIKLRNNLMDTTEDMLSAKSDFHRSQFQIARNMWSDYVKQSKQFASGGTKGLGIENLSDEKVLSRVFGDVKKVKLMKEMSHAKHVETAGIDYIDDILKRRIGGENQISARGAIREIEKRGEAIKEAIGAKKYKKIMDNLFYLDEIGRPINPSRTAIVKMMDLSPTNLFSGGMEALNYKAKSALIPMERAIKKNVKNRALTPRGLSALSDEWQREQSEKVRGPMAPKIPYRRR
ncbi:MAG: hypothetical protein CL529_12710 [Aequorivita sp.]|nr:hypothetical protein [Aequorivita sp.]|tara:strand:+ start:17208 stop:19196 length:1989 start_codon:yes stop_codon:yes gene_type:complete